MSHLVYHLLDILAPLGKHTMEPDISLALRLRSRLLRQQAILLSEQAQRVRMRNLEYRRAAPCFRKPPT
jgi:hypothetical protein